MFRRIGIALLLIAVLFTGIIINNRLNSNRNTAGNTSIDGTDPSQTPGSEALDGSGSPDATTSASVNSDSTAKSPGTDLKSGQSPDGVSSASTTEAAPKPGTKVVPGKKPDTVSSASTTESSPKSGVKAVPGKTPDTVSSASATGEGEEEREDDD